MKEYRWAILGCGAIANELAQAMAQKGRSIYAVANRTYEKAAAFAERYGVEKVYETAEELLADANVDIVYVSTPHNIHIQHIKQALQAGKHVLCEKSITLNSGELQQAMDLAAQNRLVLAEAMTIYHMPLYKRLRELTASGALGKLQLIQMNFGSYKEYNMANRFFNRDLAGGAMLDIGVYALSFVRWFMSSKPDEILSQVRYAPSGVDEQAGILLKNKQGEMATVILSLHAKQPKRGLASFEKGYFEIYEYPRGDKATLFYTETRQSQTLQTGDAACALAYEIEDMETAVSGGKNEMCLDYTEDVMDMMTQIRGQWGMTYPEETCG